MDTLDLMDTLQRTDSVEEHVQTGVVQKEQLLGFVCEFGGEGRERLGKKGMSKWKK